MNAPGGAPMTDQNRDFIQGLPDEPMGLTGTVYLQNWEHGIAFRIMCNFYGQLHHWGSLPQPQWLLMFYHLWLMSPLSPLHQGTWSSKGLLGVTGNGLVMFRGQSSTRDRQRTCPVSKYRLCYNLPKCLNWEGMPRRDHYWTKTTLYSPVNELLAKISLVSFLSSFFLFTLNSTSFPSSSLLFISLATCSEIYFSTDLWNRNSIVLFVCFAFNS